MELSENLTFTLTIAGIAVVALLTIGLIIAKLYVRPHAYGLW